MVRRSECKARNGLVIEQAWIGEHDARTHVKAVLGHAIDFRTSIRAHSTVSATKRTVGAQRAPHRHTIEVGAPLQLGQPQKQVLWLVQLEQISLNLLSISDRNGFAGRRPSETDGAIAQALDAKHVLAQRFGLFANFGRLVVCNGSLLALGHENWIGVRVARVVVAAVRFADIDMHGDDVGIDHFLQQQPTLLASKRVLQSVFEFASILTLSIDLLRNPSEK